DLVRLAVAGAIDLLADTRDEERRRLADPRAEAMLDVIALTAILCYALADLRVGDHEQALALAEARTRRSLRRQRDPLEHGAIEWLGREMAHHPPTHHDVLEFHRSPPA